jgi:hypothetical protein
MSAAYRSIISSLESIDPSRFTNDAERYQAKEALRKLLVRMETPFERIWALSFENPPLIAGLRICVDLGIWKKWTAIHKEKGEAELTLEQIIGFCEKKPEANLLRKPTAIDGRGYFIADSKQDASCDTSQHFICLKKRTPTHGNRPHFHSPLVTRPATSAQA